MSSHSSFPDLPSLALLGDRLDSAFLEAERAERARPALRVEWRLRSIVIAVLLFLLLAASAAAATLLALRGSVIPGPAKENLQPPMIVVPGSVHLAGITARDPGGTAAAWTVRLASSETGLICTTAGELRDGEFGITGLDGRFRPVSPDFVDGCGKARPGKAALIEARVFDAPQRRDVRTVITGYAGAGLRSAELQTGGTSTRMPASRDGAFVGVVRGYPEDVGVRVVLTFSDGAHTTHTFGSGPFVAPDRGGALRTESFVIDGFPNSQCVRLLGAREVQPFTSGPPLCGDPTGSRYFFDARRLRPGDRSARPGSFGWSWGRHPARTVIYGIAGSRVKQITIVSPSGRKRLRRTVNGSFLAVYPPSVDPRALEVVVEISNGRIERHRPPYNLGPLPRKR